MIVNIYIFFLSLLSGSYIQFVLMFPVKYYCQNKKILKGDSFENIHGRTVNIHSTSGLFALQYDAAISEDYASNFTFIDKILFQRFSASVASEMDEKQQIATTYKDMIQMITKMSKNPSLKIAHDQGKNVLVKLFPKWILTQYKWMFARPFPAFSARMNAWVTHWTTNWLMGNSTVYDIILPNGGVEIQQGLLVEKCRFLETSGCLSTCLNACKIPTQRFFSEEMGLDVTLLPNITDFSCKFEFGHVPLPLELDPLYTQPCLLTCINKKKHLINSDEACLN